MAKRPRLTHEDLKDTVDMIQLCGGVTAAAREMGVSHVAMLKRLQKAEDESVKARESYHSGRRLPSTAHECEAVLNDWLGRSKKTPVQHKRTPKKPEQAHRIVVASDFHAPFHSPEYVTELITREAKQTDTLIIAGDFTDSYAYSRFVRYERIGAEQEWAACDALLGHLSKAFNQIVCIEGNHDMRLERHLRAQLSPDVMFAIEQLTGGVLDPFKAIAKRYPNVRFQGHAVGRHGVGWFTQFGDLIVSHAEKFSRVPGSALRSIDEWFTDQDLVLGLKPWRLLLQAHTHQMSLVPWKADRLLAETGCLCEIHGYMLQPRVGGRPQRRGYIKLEQTNGITDINSVRLVWLDADRKQPAA